MQVRDFVKIGDTLYSQVAMKDFLLALAGKIKPNKSPFNAIGMSKGDRIYPAQPKKDTQITVKYLYGRIERLISDKTTVVAEAGDSWVSGVSLRLPQDCGFEIQLQYGSIGWSLGATLGLALDNKRRIVTLVGDGSFQMTCQEVSTIIRYELNPIIILVNNHGYLQRNSYS